MTKTTERIAIIALILLAYALGAIDALGQSVSGGVLPFLSAAPAAAAGMKFPALPGSATGAAGLGVLRYF